MSQHRSAFEDLDHVRAALSTTRIARIQSHVTERLSQHRENLRLWTDGVLVPTEPDPDERAAVERELRAAIMELKTIEAILREGAAA